MTGSWRGSPISPGGDGWNYAARPVPALQSCISYFTSFHIEHMMVNIHLWRMENPRNRIHCLICELYTDKKEKKIFLIYKEIQKLCICKVIYEEGLPDI